MLKKIISGGQTGADQGGLFAAKKMGIATGGYAPKGFKTEKGSEPMLGMDLGLVESWSTQYHIRTYQNAWASDGTIRFAKDFGTRGEICTLRGIEAHKKPHIDIDLNKPISVSEVVDWLRLNNIQVLNVAGNRESSCPGIQNFTEKFISEVIKMTNNES